MFFMVLEEPGHLLLISNFNVNILKITIMKIKHIFIFSLVALLFFSCNPNKDIYNQLDAAKKPYSEAFTYKLTDNDYTTISKLAEDSATTQEEKDLAGDIDTYKTFSKSRPVADYVPAFLATSFISLDSGSAIIVQFNFSTEQIIPTVSVGSAQYANLTEVAAAINVADAEAGDIVFVQYNSSTKGIKESFFEYDGSAWIFPVTPYVLNNADYDSMGTGSTEPGSIHMFSSSIPAINYLPTFLKLKYPYAQEGDVERLIYKSSNVNILADFTFDGNKWSNIEEKAEQFINTGTAWVFDPTVKYTMTSSDYQMLVDWVRDQDSISAYYDTTYNDEEYYFGASEYYSEFNLLLTKRRAHDPNGYFTDLTDEEVIDIMNQRVIKGIEIFLELKFPNAEPFSHGVPVYYEIYFNEYPPLILNMMKFKCTGTGTFEYSEGPTVVE